MPMIGKLVPILVLGALLPPAQSAQACHGRKACSRCAPVTYSGTYGYANYGYCYSYPYNYGYNYSWSYASTCAPSKTSARSEEDRGRTTSVKPSLEERIKQLEDAREAKRTGAASPPSLEESLQKLNERLARIEGRLDKLVKPGK
jgi:hypothetical protein